MILSKRGILGLFWLIITLFAFSQPPKSYEIIYIKNAGNITETSIHKVFFKTDTENILKTSDENDKETLLFDFNQITVYNAKAKISFDLQFTVDIIIGMITNNSLLNDGFKNRGYSGGEVFSENGHSGQVWNTNSDKNAFLSIETFSKNFKAERIDFYDQQGNLAIRMWLNNYQAKSLIVLPLEIDITYYSNKIQSRTEKIVITKIRMN